MNSFLVFLGKSLTDKIIEAIIETDGWRIGATEPSRYGRSVVRHLLASSPFGIILIYRKINGAVVLLIYMAMQGKPTTGAKLRTLRHWSNYGLTS